MFNSLKAGLRSVKAWLEDMTPGAVFALAFMVYGVLIGQPPISGGLFAQMGFIFFTNLICSAVAVRVPRPAFFVGLVALIGVLALDHFRGKVSDFYNLYIFYTWSLTLFLVGAFFLNRKETIQKNAH